MRIYKVPLFFRRLFRKAGLWEVSTQTKTIYLTFDDGPIPEVTPLVLEILKQYDAKATFFCVGENISKHPDTLKQVLDAGHKIGNHTYNHLRGWEVSQNDYWSNILQSEQYQKTEFFRPPYGRITSKQLRIIRKHFKIVFWSVLTYDYSKYLDVKSALPKIIKATHPGSIVLFHDSKKAKENVLYLLPRFIEYFLAQGYTFETL